MPVRRERAADAQPVRARLLLHHAPAAVIALLHLAQPANQVVPEYASLHAHQSALRVEFEYAIQPPGVKQHAAVQELLPAHRVPSPGDADAVAFFTSGGDRLLNFADCARRNHAFHRRLVQLRMNVVECWHAPILMI